MAGVSVACSVVVMVTVSVIARGVVVTVIVAGDEIQPIFVIVIKDTSSRIIRLTLII